MKIIRYNQFINEELNDTPESYISVCLNQIKRKIDTMFEFQESAPDDENMPKSKSIMKAKADSRDKTSLNFKDLGVRLESSEISKYSKLYDSLTVKFTDDNATYNLLISIDIKEALPNGDEDFSYKDIKKCYIKFKKYDLDTFEVLGQITKNVEMDKINEEFIINLKIELDEEFGDDEEFKIETE